MHISSPIVTTSLAAHIFSASCALMQFLTISHSLHIILKHDSFPNRRIIYLLAEMNKNRIIRVQCPARHISLKVAWFPRGNELVAFYEHLPSSIRPHQPSLARAPDIIHDVDPVWSGSVSPGLLFILWTMFVMQIFMISTPNCTKARASPDSKARKGKATFS